MELPPTARNLTPAGLIAVAWCGFGLAALLVALRCYARISEQRALHADDYWILAALFFLLTNAILQTLQTPSTYYLAWLQAGRQSPVAQTLEVGNVYVRYEFVIIALFWSVTWSVKASFLAMYRRLFSRLPEYLRLWWAVCIFTALAMLDVGLQASGHVIHRACISTSVSARRRSTSAVALSRYRTVQPWMSYLT